VILTRPTWPTPEFIARQQANAVLSGFTARDTWAALEFAVGHPSDPYDSNQQHVARYRVRRTTVAQ
jgi:hypothetical protein